jgi:hypothetical protein
MRFLLLRLLVVSCFMGSLLQTASIAQTNTGGAMPIPSGTSPGSAQGSATSQSAGTTQTAQSGGQPNTGTVSGKVSDAESGEIMRGATVQLVDAKKGAYTDVKGTYTIRNITPGKYSLRYNYIGYKVKTVSDVEVIAGQTVQLNVVLESAVKKTEEVVITVRRINDNAAASLAQRKNAAQVSDGISEAEIKKLPDADAGQALKRVPGVTITEGKFVVVRGVSERYSNTTLNGASLSSTEPDKKAFAFDMFPAEFLQSANVAKSFTADLPGNFAGGLVQLNTIDFPQGLLLKLSLSTTYNDNVSFVANKFNGYEGGRTDWLAFDDGTRRLPSRVPANRSATDVLLRRAGDPDDATGASEWINVGKSFNSKVWNQQTLTVPVNSSIGLAFANLFNFDDNDFGVVANLSYGNGYTINTVRRGGIQSDGRLQFDGAGSIATRSVSWSGLLNLAYKIGASSSITFKNIYNRSSDDEVLSLDTKDFNQSRDRQFYSAQFVEKSLYSGQLGGEHTLTALANSLFDWRAGYSISSRDEPDLRRLRYSRAIGSNETFSADIPNTQQGDGTVAGRFYSALQDNLLTGGFNFTLPFENVAKLKVGALIERRNRTFSARSLTIIRTSAILTDVPTNVDLTQSPGRLLDTSNFRGDGLGISEDSKLSDTYKASEDLNAAYVMGDVPLRFDNDTELRFIAGVRAEQSVQRLESFDQQGTPVLISPQFFDLLPSFHVVYRLAKDMNARASATRTLARPSLREFAPFAFFDFQSQSRVQGNPNLIRALVNNFDLRYEWFLAPGEVFAISGFYKTFENAIEETIQPGSVIARTFANAPSLATVLGTEIEFRKSFDFIAPALAPLVFSANVSLIRSNITVSQGNVTDTRQMWGQSPYSINIGFFYTEPTIGTSLNLAYNRAGERIVQVAQLGQYEVRPGQSPHVFELPRDLVDFSIIQPLGNLEIKLVARDLLNQALVWEHLGTRIQSNIRGRNFTLGVSFRIQ